MGYLITRREALERCTAMGLLLPGPGLTLSTVSEAWEQAEKATCKPTPRNEVGPFYKKHAPSSNHLRALGDLGMPLSVSGTIFDTRGEQIQDAVVEVWHTDHFGRYDLTGYKFRAQMRPPTGTYNFETVMPGHYPDRVCQHVHYMVSAPGHKTLVTQLYFATDPALEGNPDKNYLKDPVLQSRELIRPVMLQTDSDLPIAKVVFDLCLERS